ncbi:MAG: terpene cyclase/mutase family protein [Planctomycetes bacterium]|nr:terpene cyclase/mutase family protein [Planctomycetota bacterium]
MTRPLDPIFVVDHDPPRRWLPGWLTETPYWAVSATVHLIILLILGGIVLSTEREPTPETRVIVSREFRTRPYDPTERRWVDRQPKILETPREPTPLEVIKPKIVSPRPKGRPSASANKELNSDAIADAFGTSGAASSIVGLIDGDSRRVGEGPGGSEDAVLAALHWLRRHQHPDGHWSSRQFYTGRAVDPDAYRDECWGYEGFDVGVTALAMLAFLGHGHTYKDSCYPEFVEVMRKSTDWLLKQQEVAPGDPERDGVIGRSNADEWVYNHAIATLALSELLFLTGDRFRLSQPVASAAAYCMRAQNEGYGWKYDYAGAKNDSSVTGWMLLALKTAKACSESRLITKIRPEEFAPHFAGAMRWFDRVRGSNGRVGYEAPGDEGSILRAHGDPYPYSKRLSCMTAVAVLCRLFAGEARSSEPVRDGVAVLMDELPRWAEPREKRPSTINMYHWYYATYALFQYGGAKWRQWNEALLETLLPTQTVGGDADGSWAPLGEWGRAGGRVYSTAIGAMTLEVYYRYRRAGGES